MTTYHCLIITPSGKILDDQIESLTAPGKEGFFGVLAHHAPMVTLLTKGVLQIKKDTDVKYFAIDPGILEVASDNRVLILSDSATPTEITKIN